MKTSSTQRLSRLLCRPARWTVALLACATLSHASDWPQYRGPNLDGTSPEKLALKTWPATGLRTVWKAPTTLGFSSFTVSGGKAYTIVGRDISGALQEVCIALDAANGKELWARPMGIAKYEGGGNSGTESNKGGDGPRSTPTVDGNRVYVLSGNLLLGCLDAKTGQAVWSHDLMKEFAGRNISWKNAASPVIDGNLVFVAGGGPGESLLAFDKTSGKLVWKGEDDKMTHSTPVASSILGTRQIIFFTQNGLVSVAPLTGKVLWRYAFPFKVSTAISPVVSGDIVYCSAGYGVGAGACKIVKVGETFTATELWRKPNELANHWSTPIVKDGYLYGMFQFKEYGTGPVKCVELATGKIMWQQPGFGPGNVILADGNLLALSDAGELVLIKATPQAYQEVSRAKILDGKCWSTPVLSNGRVYARSTTEGVCVDLTGTMASR